MNCKRCRVLAGVSEETIADDIRTINGAVKAVWDGLEKVSKPKRGSMQLNLKKDDGKISVIYQKDSMGKLQGMFSVFYERHPNNYYLDTAMNEHKLKITKLVNGGVE